MLDISTSKWRLKGCEGGASLIYKNPYRVVYVPHENLPSLHAMQHCSEAAFDKMMQELFDKSGPSFSR